jgi:cell division protein FtsL
MARLNFMLLAVLVLCALGLVTSQHKARKLYAQFEQEQERARALDVEYGQLQLEQSTWAMHGRVEKLAPGRCRHRLHVPARLRLLDPAPERRLDRPL